MKTIYLTLGLVLLGSQAGAACHQGPFEDFFRTFSQNVEVQKSAVPDRFMLSEIDHDADPESVPLTREATRDALEWPLIPDLAEFEAAGGSLRFEVVEQGHAAILSGDSGYLVTLIFRQDPCWLLHSLKDDSI